MRTQSNSCIAPAVFRWWLYRPGRGFTRRHFPVAHLEACDGFECGELPVPHDEPGLHAPPAHPPRGSSHVVQQLEHAQCGAGNRVQHQEAPVVSVRHVNPPRVVSAHTAQVQLCNQNRRNRVGGKNGQVVDLRHTDLSLTPINLCLNC